MESIYQLTRSQICGNMRIATDNCQEATSCPPTRAELDCDGGGAGEGAGYGGAEIVSITIVIITNNGAAVALGGGSVIDLHVVIARTPSTPCMNIETVEGEGNCLSIG